jgi:HAD superfamily hydrolase (TIGR01509 family)
LTPLQALIFDVDGTLAETEEAHRLAFNAAFRAADLDWTWDVDLYRDLLAVTGGKERIRWHVERSDPPNGERALADVDLLHAAKTEFYRRAVERGEVMLRPGVRRLIAEAQAAGVRLAVATTTTAANVEALVAATFGRPAASLFEVIVAGEDVTRKKPDPEVYLIASQRLGLPAAACIAFEDSAPGLAAARAAGLRTVVSPSLYCNGFDMADATWAVGSLDEISLAKLLD